MNKLFKNRKKIVIPRDSINNELIEIIKNQTKNNRLIKWYIISVLGTIGLAVFACLSWYTQTKFYEKTTRPFINISFESLKSIDDSTFTVTYRLKNFGSLPAKNVQSATLMLGHKYEKGIFDFDPNNVFDAIYPNYDIPKDSKKLNFYAGYEKHYLHIKVIYQDIDEKKTYQTETVFYYDPNKGIFKPDRTYFN